LEQLDSALIEQVKLIACKIVRLWEEYGHDVISLEARTKIKQIALQLPQIMGYYYQQIASAKMHLLNQ
jgi:hypothetical protein